MKTICKECGKELLSVNNTHLLKCSKMTMQEYSIKHSIPISEMLSQEGWTHKEEAGAGVDKGIQISHVEPTEEEYAVLVGTLLGSGSIHSAKTLDKSAYYLCMQYGIKQLDLLLWKGLKLCRFGAKFFQYYKYDVLSHRYVTHNFVRTKMVDCIADLAQVFYQEGGTSGKKIQDFNFIQKHLTPLALAIWYMDSGYYCATSTICELHTQGLSKKEVDTLGHLLYSNFDLRVCRHLVGDANEYVIRFSAEERAKLFNIIDPYIIPSMWYKLGSVKTPLVTICKRLSFDSAHFLEDHPAKCFNLHGGRYLLDVYIQGCISPETGMVVDYAYLKKIVKKYIVDLFDHHLINEQEQTLQWRSTTELMCIFIWFTLIEFLPGLEKIKLWETPDSFCEYRGPSYAEITNSIGVHEHLEFLRSFVDLNRDFKSDRIIGPVEEVRNESLFDDTLVCGVSLDLSKAALEEAQSEHGWCVDCVNYSKKDCFDLKSRGM